MKQAPMFYVIASKNELKALSLPEDENSAEELAKDHDYNIHALVRIYEMRGDVEKAKHYRNQFKSDLSRVPLPLTISSFNDKFIRAFEGNAPKNPPVWLMRQAGRYMPEYRALREKASFLELCKNPELAAEATLQPIERLGVDAAILFSDILIPLEAMGIELDFNPAPLIKNPVRTLKEAEALIPLKNPKESLPFVYKAITKILNKPLRVPLIGFCGAPFTLAVYLAEGGGSKNFTEIKSLMLTNPQAYRLIMEKLSEAMALYLKGQLEAGCYAVQIFDTWAGILSPEMYGEFVFPYVKQLVEELKGARVIYFAKDGAPFFPYLKELKDTALGLDWKTPISYASKFFEGEKILQGNLDPALLYADFENIKGYVDKILEEGRKNKAGYIFNLGHGLLPTTPVENVTKLVRYIQYG